MEQVDHSYERGPVIPNETNRQPRQNLFWRSIDGFVLSIIAIGCIRAWLSFQTGILSSVTTYITSSSDLVLLRAFVFILAFIAFFHQVR